MKTQEPKAQGKEQRTKEIMDLLEGGKLPARASDWLHLSQMLAGRVWEDIRWHGWEKWLLRRRLLTIDTEELKQRLRHDGYHEWTDGNKVVFWKGEKRMTFTMREEGPNA